MSFPLSTEVNCKEEVEMLTRYEFAKIASLSADACFEIGRFLLTKPQYAFALASYITVI